METYFVDCLSCLKTNVVKIPEYHPKKVRVTCWNCRESFLYRLRTWKPPEPTEYDKRQVRKGRPWKEREERGEYQRRQLSYPNYHCKGRVTHALVAKMLSSNFL